MAMPSPDATPAQDDGEEPVGSVPEDEPTPAPDDGHRERGLAGRGGVRGGVRQRSPSPASPSVAGAVTPTQATAGPQLPRTGADLPALLLSGLALMVSGMSLRALCPRALLAAPARPARKLPSGACARLRPSVAGWHGLPPSSASASTSCCGPRTPTDPVTRAPASSTCWPRRSTGERGRTSGRGSRARSPTAVSRTVGSASSSRTSGRARTGSPSSARATASG